MIDDLLTSANKTGSGWVRIEPETEEVLRIWKQSVFDREKNTGICLVKAPHDMQPREVLVVDISKAEKDLLSEMKAKTRYNIRLAEKKGVRIFSTREKKYQEAFFELIEATAKRQNILPHPKSYYEKMLSVFSEEDLSLFVAEFEGYVLAANLILFSGDTATYLHGGTSDVHREMMAPVLLQWEQMRKRNGADALVRFRWCPTLFG
jgi:lipid II:glycine glycyltransferase (peptidoglycan interpeptide bridge formation enzyme)